MHISPNSKYPTSHNRQIRYGTGERPRFLISDSQVPNDYLQENLNSTLPISKYFPTFDAPSVDSSQSASTLNVGVNRLHFTNGARVTGQVRARTYNLNLHHGDDRSTVAGHRVMDSLYICHSDRHLQNVRHQFQDSPSHVDQTTDMYPVCLEGFC